jgi:protein polybromo-1
MLKNHKKEDGTSVCDTFIRAPKRRQEPSYYDVVSNPIDLLKVQHKMKSDAYDDLNEFAEDIELIVNNAKAFYKQGTAEYQDACTLWDVFQKNKKKLEEEDAALPKKVERRGRKSANNDDEESDNETDSEVYEDLFVTIMNATDPADNRHLNLQFQLLPSKKLYPDYYDVIEHPIDLKFIANKIQTNAYTCISDMEKDVLQMTKNACTFNEPGSQIYKDAKMLRKVFLARKAEIETGKYKKAVTKKSKSVSAQIAALGSRYMIFKMFNRT